MKDKLSISKLQRFHKSLSSPGGIFRGATQMFLSYIVGFGAQGIYFVVLARTLGVVQFGTFAAALALASICSVLVGLGAGSVLVRDTARSKAAYSTQMGTALVYISVTAIPFGAVCLLIGMVAGESFVAVLVPLIISEMVFSRLLDLSLQVFQAQDRLRGTAILNGLAGIVRMLAVLLFYLVSGRDAKSWSIWYSLVSVCLGSGGVLSCIKAFGRPRFSGHSLRTTWRSGIFFSIGMASRIVYLDVDKYMLQLLGPLGSAGMFAAASRIVGMAGAPIQAVVYSMNTRLFRAGSTGYVSVWHSIFRPLWFILGYGLVATLALIGFAPLAPMLLGGSFRETQSAVAYLAPLVLIQGLGYLFGDALMGLGRQGLRSLLQAGAALLSFALNMALIPKFGWMGAAISALSCATLLSIILVVVFRIKWLAEKSGAAALLVSSLSI